ncbi:MAG: penicillin acylase family protein, partial [Planctomycetota bacterium]
IHEARTLEEGLDIMASWKSAPQNVAIASSDGRVGLTMSGYLPRRIGFDGTVPTEWSGGVRWAGELPMSARPRFVRDASGYVFSANNRIASVESLAPIGTWFPDGSRAHRIDEVLSREKPVDELDMLALQNDTRTRRHDAWRDLVLERVPADTEDDLLAGARVAASEWSGHADLDEDAHAFVRSVEWAVTGRVLAPFEELVRAHDPNTGRATRFSPDVALRLIAAEPAHLLSPAYDSWDMLVLDGIRSAASSVASRNGGELRPRWGDVHTASIEHPIAQIAGDIMPGLRAPSDGLAGDWSSVRVTGSNFGASVRIVVAPGHEERGVFHMPGGQSGDPRSPHFLDGHAAWVTGEATPLLPGEAVRTITLEPAAP